MSRLKIDESFFVEFYFFSPETHKFCFEARLRLKQEIQRKNEGKT